MRAVKADKSVTAIQQAVRHFRDARDWRQFHIYRTKVSDHSGEFARFLQRQSGIMLA